MAQTALITGGTRGIGLGIAEALAEQGFNLVLCGRRSPEDVQPVVTRLKEMGADVIYSVCDVSNLDDHEVLLQTAYDHFGDLNVLVNNAGVAPEVRADILEATPESFDRLIAINLRGPYFLTQKVARRMLEAKAKSPETSYAIINISSISAYTASPSRGDYCISKSGLAMMTKLFAARLAEAEIPVFEIRPGIVKTDMTAAVQEKYDRLIAEGITPIRKWIMPEDVGKAVAACATGMIPLSTGQVIDIDAGFHLHIL